jgi:TPR repeat protein/AcrR family transcriptional regulator
MDVAQARRTAIAAARRIIARDGAGRLTLDGVGHEAGLPIGALYGLFNNEQELLMAVAADDLAALAKGMRGNTSGGSSPELIQRVEVIETAFASVIDRHQKSLLARNDMASWVEQCVKDLQQQVDVTDRAFAQMRSDVKATLQSNPDPDPPVPAKIARLLVEPPLITDTPEPSLPPSEPNPVDLPPVLPAQPESVTSNSEEAVLMDNYLLDARRAAISTQAGNERERHEIKRRSKRTRIVAVALLGPIAILATAAIVLNRNVVTATPSSSTAPEQPQLAEAASKLVNVAPGNPVPQPAPQPPAQPAPPQVTATAPAAPSPGQLAATAPLDKLTQLATSGDMKAERDLGLKYLAGDGVPANENEAARWLMRAAYRGEPTAEYWLGTLYARGHGVPEDAFQANHWYEAAAQKGNRRAMHSFAVAYFQGWGVEKNYAEAARWFRSAADLGFVDSQFNLAVLYERGAGIQQSLTDAYKWYAVAAKGGDKEAETRVAVLATQLAPADLALAQQAAESFKPAPMDESANLAGGAQATDG